MIRLLPALLLVAAAAGMGVAAPAPAPRAADPGIENVPYDGRFTFVRLRFRPSGGRFMGYTPPWAHDYPRAERNLMSILGELTALAPYLDGGNILDADDPELFKYPVAYLSEPGYWTQSDEEVLGLRSYLEKGGFLIVDDFRGGDLRNFQEQIARVLPGAELVRLDVSHPIFNSFFEIESLEVDAPTFRRFHPVFLGIHEGNDPRKRLLAVVNYNNDIGDLWEFSDTGWLPVDLSNAAYKLGINYVMYGMTH